MKTDLRFAAAASALVGAVWAGAAFADWPFRAVLRLDPFYGGVCEGCDLSGRLLIEARFVDVSFPHANFSEAVLTRAQAGHSAFDGADFSNAILDDADFSYSRFGAARLTGAQMIGARFFAADLSQAVGLTQSQLSQACGDDETKLPPGLSISFCDPCSAPSLPISAW